jgi:hypothetical protein
MKKSFFILLVPLLIGSTCCKKEEPSNPYPLGEYTIIKGKVLEFGTNKPIPDAQVLIMGFSQKDFGGPTNSRPMDTVFSKADGSYEAKFRHEEVDDFQCHVKVHNYYDGRDSGNPFIWRGRENTINCILDPFAWIRIHVKNVNPLSSQDYISFWGGKGWGNSSSDYIGLNGAGIDTFITRRIAGNQLQKITGFIERSGQNRILITDSIYCKGGDTTFFKLHF